MAAREKQRVIRDRLSPAFFNHVAKTRRGYHRVVNCSVPDPVRETEAQKKEIYKMLPRDAWKSFTILDVGCGVGRLTGWLSKISAGATGLDWSPEMLKIANSTYKDVKFMRGSLYDPALDLKGAPFGLTFTWCVFIHVLNDNDWMSAVANLCRWSAGKVLYCDKVNDNAIVDYVKVRPVERIVEEFARNGYALSDQGKFVGYEEDVFALLLFEKEKDTNDTSAGGIE